MQWVSKETHMHYDLLFLALFISFAGRIIFYGKGFLFLLNKNLFAIQLKWILSMFGNTLGYRLPIKVLKTMFLISGLNIFFSLVVFMSTIAFICHLFLCLLFVESHWEANYGDNLPSTICIISEIRGKASLSFLCYFFSVRVALLCRLCVQSCVVALLSGIFDQILCTQDKKCNMKWLFSHSITIFMSHCFIWN